MVNQGFISHYEPCEEVLAFLTSSDCSWHTNPCHCSAHHWGTKAQICSHRAYSDSPLEPEGMFDKRLNLSTISKMALHNFLFMILRTFHIFTCVTCGGTTWTLTIFNSFPKSETRKSLKNKFSQHGITTESCSQHFMHFWQFLWVPSQM